LFVVLTACSFLGASVVVLTACSVLGALVVVLTACSILQYFVPLSSPSSVISNILIKWNSHSFEFSGSLKLGYIS
jgi:Na+-translocating ferredoxin:NAD+ oxidoreductase RnfA subunit